MYIDTSNQIAGRVCLNAAVADSLATTLDVAHGGTGATTAAGARANLGAVNKAGDVMTGKLDGYNASGAWIVVTHQASFRNASVPTAGNAATVLSQKTATGAWGIGALSGVDSLYFIWGSDADYNATLAGNAVNTVQTITFSSNGDIQANKVYGAVWNDYAECRTSKKKIPAGRVVVEVGDDTLALATERLMPGANIVSDTFGFAIGKTEKSETPIAVSGRVLAYPLEDRESFMPGDPVCSGPNGTVSKMTREEVIQYPDRIVGTVSCVPDYEVWGKNIKVDGRIWIKVK